MNRTALAILTTFAVIIGGVVVAAHLMLDRMLHRGIEVLGSEATGVSISVDSVSLSLLSGTVSLSGLVMGNPEGFSTDRSLSVRHCSVTIRPLSLLRGVVEVEEVVIHGATVTWEGLRGNNHRRIRSNVETYASRYGNPDRGGTVAAPGGTPGRMVVVRNVVIEDSYLDFVAGGRTLATVPLATLRLGGIGVDAGGETAEETLKQAYERFFASAEQSAGEHTRLFREKLNELGASGSGWIDRAKESAPGVRDTATRKLEELRKNLERLFR